MDVASGLLALTGRSTSERSFALLTTMNGLQHLIITNARAQSLICIEFYFSGQITSLSTKIHLPGKFP